MAVTTRPPHEATVSPSPLAASRVHFIVIGLVLVALLVPLASTPLGLYDAVTHWGKFVHALDAVCLTIALGLVLLGWRDQVGVDLTDELATLMMMCAGIVFGVLWETVEFIRDWVAYSDLQKSNSDTMTDFLVSDVAAVIAALLAVRLYRHVLRAPDRHALGTLGERLVDGPTRVLDRHGFAITIIAAALMALAVAALWFAGRPVPGFPIG